MADDRIKHDDDLKRNMGGAGKEGQDYSQQSPGRTGQGGQQGGQHAGGQKGGSQQGSQFGGQKGSRNMEDDEDLGAGGAGKTGGAQNRGGQNR